MSKIKIVTHNAKFHVDDVFGVAALFILLGKENCEVFRTRDEEIINSGDYVLDVGEISDPDQKRFDHHQLGGAGERENGIPYASIGLIWKAYGEEITGSKAIAESIDKSLIQQIDAGDNGKDIFVPIIPDVMPATIGGIIDLYRFTWKEKEDWDKAFLECVHWAMSVLSRKIKIAKDFEEGARIVEEAYINSPDKRIVYFDNEYSLGRELVTDKLSAHPEPLYAVLYRKDHAEWQVVAMRKKFGSFDLRKPLPESWAAKHGEELEKITGVLGANFCHRRCFMCTTKTEEAARRLAEIALNA